MRGDDHQQLGVFSYVSLEERVPQNHPLRPIRQSVDEIFRAMNKEFDGLYAKTGRPSIAPERLLRALDFAQLRDRISNSSGQLFNGHDAAARAVA